MNLKIPHHGVLYCIVITLVLGLGVLVVFLESAAIHPGLVQNNASGLHAYYQFHVTYVAPHMSTVFLRLFLSNAGVALFILLVPLYWVGIWWLNRNLLVPVIQLMRGTVLLLVLALGHNSFSYAWVTMSRFPFPVFLTMYAPHGWLEMLAFILSGTFSLLCIDSLHEYLHTDSSARHPGEIAVFIFGRVYRVFIVILFLLAVSAAIECWVTPLMVTSVLEHLL
ncbi:MAG: stage II sporulation protein M, partial [Methanoregula sp.]|nr:stage II sporulation protein M [Methanoregula sp.]